jgi:arginase family enzyme
MQREKNNNFILDFTGVYDDEFAKEKTSLTWIDCTDITGCDMYVSDEAEKQIGERVDSVGIHGIHFIDSGNYHYVTKIMTDRIKEPFSLVVFDHHTDMQKPMIEGLTSCGDWAGKVIKDNPYICQLILVGPEKKDINAIGLRSNKLITYSAQEIRAEAMESKTNQIDLSVPVYISIDKDILDESISETNWSQGHMKLGTLEHMLGIIIRNQKVLGIDICGECDTNMPLPEYMEDEEKNGELNKELYNFLLKRLKKYSL